MTFKQDDSAAAVARVNAKRSHTTLQFRRSLRSPEAPFGGRRLLAGTQSSVIVSNGHYPLVQSIDLGPKIIGRCVTTKKVTHHHTPSYLTVEKSRGAPVAYHCPGILDWKLCTVLLHPNQPKPFWTNYPVRSARLPLPSRLVIALPVGN